MLDSISEIIGSTALIVGNFLYKVLPLMLDSISEIIGSTALIVGNFLYKVLPFLPMSITENPATLMVTVGFGGQFLFAMRFIVQWIKSEEKKKSVIPLAFWYFSVGGGLVLLCYALWRKDPVIICGQGLGLFIYARNLYFILWDPAKQSDT